MRHLQSLCHNLNWRRGRLRAPDCTLRTTRIRLLAAHLLWQTILAANYSLWTTCGRLLLGPLSLSVHDLNHPDQLNINLASLQDFRLFTWFDLKGSRTIRRRTIRRRTIRRRTIRRRTIRRGQLIAKYNINFIGNGKQFKVLFSSFRLQFKILSKGYLHLCSFHFSKHCFIIPTSI